jgi:hypothetical protein
VNNDHTRILESKIIKIDILPPEFVFWSAECHVWQAFTKYPSVVYLDKLLSNSKKIFLLKMTWWGFCLQEHLRSSIVLPWEDKLCLKVKSMAYSHKRPNFLLQLSNSSRWLFFPFYPKNIEI